MPVLAEVGPVCLIVVAVLAGSLAQRLAGVGFSLIVAPALVLAIGPRAGVELTNLLTLAVAFAVFASSARRVDLARSLLLVPAGLTGVLAGAVLAGSLPARPLQVAVGTVTGLGLLAVGAARGWRVRAGRPVTICAGVASGLTTATAGAGGPALTVYAMATGWPQQEFVATGQLSFGCQAAAALAIKGVPSVPLSWIGCIAAAMLAGLAAGAYLTTRTSSDRARQATIALAGLAALTTVITALT
jgi:uncharacterized membrane protein YfcA